MSHPKIAQRLWIATAAVLALAVALFLLDGSDQQSARPEHTVSEKADRTPERALEPAELAESAPTNSERTTAEAVAPELVEAPPAAESDVAFKARIEVLDNAWMKRVRQGSLAWRKPQGADAGSDTAEFERIYIDEGTAEFALLPRAPGEFGPIEISGLAAHCVDMRELAPPVDGCTLAIVVELEAGPKLEWRADVRGSDRVPVDILLEGRPLPPSRGVSNRLAPKYERTELRGVSLPLELPRWADDHSIWVLAPGFVSRTCIVPRGVDVVQIELERATKLRVLHDVDPTAGFVVVALRVPAVNDARFAVDVADEVTIDTLDEGKHRLWIENRRGVIVSRIAQAVLSADETTVVDLTAASLTDGRGSLVANVAVEALPGGVPKAKLEFLLEQLVEDAGESKWLNYRTLKVGDAATNTGTALAFRVQGLDPGSYRATLQPLGATAIAEVAAGGETVVEFALDCCGAVRFVLPANFDSGQEFASIEVARHDRVQGNTPSWSVDRRADSIAQPVDLVCGEYVASGSLIRFTEVDGRRETVWSRLASVPFRVDAGATTEVALERVGSIQVRVEARHAATRELVVMAPEWWIGIAVVGEVSGKPLLRTVAFGADVHTCNTVVWNMPPSTEPAAVTFPEHANYVAAPLAPLVLDNDQTITIWLTAKDG